ncbi:arsenate reductase ArsC [Thalassoglobus sp. JC818]|uniref:arsenate reductase ArsC n=1 Tax=Thalassoglobus sp. JC818 TaxID=3232136 RepID=UPI0034576391
MQRVLILCTGNSCRSQMAEALWESLGAGKWESHSAGSKPSGYVHPLAVQVMSELGIDISSYESKSVGQIEDQDFDLVVTVCDNARESCPVLPGAKSVLHWPFEDPADATGTDVQKLEVFRRIRDEIKQKISGYLNSVSQGV